MTDILKTITEKQKKLSSFRPLPPALVKNLEAWFKVELTYNSNAIEGNTLSRKETALVIEKGLTVAGKSITEHLEAKNHGEALEFIKSLANKKRHAVTEENLLQLHHIILSKIDDQNAGRYRHVPVRIAGSTVILPNPMKVPGLMSEYFSWLRKSHPSVHPATIAVDAHLKLVSVHPFTDGNGRTARLLMNLLLMQAGYPPALIKKEERLNYINAIEKAQLFGQLDDYYRLIYGAIDRSLTIYLKALDQKESPQRKTPFHQVLKIGELAKRTGETVPTIRYWTQEGLLSVADTTAGGYQLYDESMVDRVKKIRHLQREKRLSIEEISGVLQKEA